MIPAIVTRPLRLLRRRIYGLRAYIPGLRDHHRMETMVGPVGFWKELEAYQLGALRHHGLSGHHRVLDLGCGPLQGGVALIRFLEPSRYTGVDIRGSHLDAAFYQVARHGLADRNPRLIRSEVYGDDLLNGERFDYIWASQILYYFDAKMLGDVLRFAHRRLSPGGRFLGDFINPDLFENIYYQKCGFIRHTLDDLDRIATEAGMRATCLGRLEDFGYPSRLTLRSSLLLEFTRKD